MKYDISEILRTDKVHNCTVEDIHIHYDIVAPLVQSVDKDTFKARMLQAVAGDTAYTTLDNSCFLYYLSTDKYTAEGVCFYGKDNPMGIFMLFTYIFNNMDEDTTILRLVPHSINEMKTYKSLLLPGSIKNWYRLGKPVVIRLDKMKKKIKYLLTQRVTL